MYGTPSRAFVLMSETEWGGEGVGHEKPSAHDDGVSKMAMHGVYSK